MIDRKSTAPPALTTTPQPLEAIFDGIEEELARLTKARPALQDRLVRAAHILVTHVSCKRQRMIRARIRSGEIVAYLVTGSGGAIYKVSPKDWSCSCPDFHRSSAPVCKHGLACYVLWKAAYPSSRKKPCKGCEGQFPRRDLVELHTDHETYFLGDLLCKGCADRTVVEW